jgi:hypothetical protein
MKEKDAYSAPHILEKHVDGHVTTGIDGEASKGRCHGVVISVATCAWGTSRWKKRKGLVQGCQAFYSPTFTG